MLQSIHDILYIKMHFVGFLYWNENKDVHILKHNWNFSSTSCRCMSEQ